MPTPSERLPLWKQGLADRGLLDAALAAGWTSYDWYSTPGWSFPLHQANGQKWILPEAAGPAAGREALRWKALDSTHHPKYLWGYPDQKKDDGHLRQPVGCQYYWLPGGDIKAQVEEAWGALYLACGEPDLLTVAAAGRRNVTSFFGEGSIPESAPESFRKLGVTRLIYYPDNDNTGWDDAQKLYQVFRGSGIDVEAYALPAEHDGRAVNDLNDLWVACRFDAVAFWNVLSEARSLAFLADDPPEDLPQDDNREAWERYHGAIEVALGATWSRTQKGWSKPMACIFAAHDNDDRSPSAGYHREKHKFRCFKCSQSWKGDEVADRLGIARPAPPTPSSLKIQPAQPFLAAGRPSVASAPPLITIHTSDESLTRYKERLRGIGNIEPVPFPFKGLNHLGGFCRVIPLGKIIGILGVSGGGKTSFIETLTDAWRRMGYHILWWGPEWTWEEMSDRAVQRYGGLSMVEMMNFELWQVEHAHNIPLDDRLGEYVSEALVTKSEGICDDIMAWPGKAHYLDRMEVSLPELLDAAQTRLDELDKVGQKPKIAAFDYIQLSEITGARSDGERIPRAISKIKGFCTDNRVVGLVGTQARKEDSEEAREEGKLLSAEAAQYFRDDKTNLFITLNPDYDDQGNMTGEGWINVVKNSGGKKGKVAGKPDPMHLRWRDTRPIPVTQIVEDAMNRPANAPMSSEWRPNP